MATTNKAVFNVFTGNLDYLPVDNNSSSNPNVVISGVPCDNTVVNGDVVIMNNGIATEASAASYATSNAIGIAENVVNNICNIRTSGVTGDIYTNLDTTADYYLSDISPGKLTTTAPTASGTVILRMGQAFDSTSFLVNKSSRIVRS